VAITKPLKNLGYIAILVTGNNPDKPMPNRATSPKVDFLAQPELVIGLDASAAMRGISRGEHLRRIATAACIEDGTLDLGEPADAQ
jgi:hypothetical protein